VVHCEVDISGLRCSSPWLQHCSDGDCASRRLPIGERGCADVRLLPTGRSCVSEEGGCGLVCQCPGTAAILLQNTMFTVLRDACSLPLGAGAVPKIRCTTL
jgi:hypothetical protein